MGRHAGKTSRKKGTRTAISRIEQLDSCFVGGNGNCEQSRKNTLFKPITGLIEVPHASVDTLIGVNYASNASSDQSARTKRIESRNNDCLLDQPSSKSATCWKVLHASSQFEVEIVATERRTMFGQWSCDGGGSGGTGTRTVMGSLSSKS